jgi:hypothetical protein
MVVGSRHYLCHIPLCIDLLPNVLRGGMGVGAVVSSVAVVAVVPVVAVVSFVAVSPVVAVVPLSVALLWRRHISVLWRGSCFFVVVGAVVFLATSRSLTTTPLCLRASSWFFLFSSSNFYLHFLFLASISSRTNAVTCPCFITPKL